MLSQLNSSRCGDDSIENTLLNDSIARQRRSILMKPISPESILMEKEKDARMRNISEKLEQLRADIRKEIIVKK